ncbi:MAG: gliding motility protein GldL [Bacteroidales bacterium]|nr:gliding motility protein GldL [Bacteroidales bacterium]
MGLGNFVKSRTFKKFMAKLYGWGAAVVILGALFKINHYPGADYMLVLGLGTEALIFFFSAFEPPHVEPDWSLVYPELAGIYHDHPDKKKKAKASINGGSVSQELDKMLTEAKVGPELIASLGKGMQNLSDNSAKLADITQAAVATDQYVKNIGQASSSANELSISYKKATEFMNADFKNQTETTARMQKTIDNFMTNLNSSVEATTKYKDEVEILSNKVAALNTVYGNMLTAMNVNTKK